MTDRRATGALSAADYIDGVRNGDRIMLGRAITLIESSLPSHAALATAVLDGLGIGSDSAVRIGITGVPGVGKSTFIEALGCHVIEQGHRVAVLAVDPSSVRTGGSILGDRTRMERLSRDARCFIRPTPSAGTTGGVARRTMEAMMLCEAAGFDVIFIETVGVGQNEVAVRNLADLFLLLLLPNAGDSLQGIKRGIMELADCVVVNKADGVHVEAAATARQETESALALLQPATVGWRTSVQVCSSLEGTGIADIWKTVGAFAQHIRTTGLQPERRAQQLRDWFRNRLEQRVNDAFFHNPATEQALPATERAFAEGRCRLKDGMDALLKAGFEGALEELK